MYVPPLHFIFLAARLNGKFLRLETGPGKAIIFDTTISETVGDLKTEIQEEFLGATVTITAYG